MHLGTLFPFLALLPAGSLAKDSSKRDSSCKCVCLIVTFHFEMSFFTFYLSNSVLDTRAEMLAFSFGLEGF